MLSLTIPDSVLCSIKLPEKSVHSDLMKFLSVILYEKGALGIGKASELCGKSRVEFMQILDEEGVALNYDDAELDRDLANLRSFL